MSPFCRHPFPRWFTEPYEFLIEVNEIKAKATALEDVTKDNTSQIRELKIAK